MVEVELGGRAALQELWSVDISKGGMFLRTEAPPPRGRRLEVRLSTSGGPLTLTAEVVHVVDVATAEAYGQSPGVGVQFIDLTRELRERIEQYLEGVLTKLSVDLAPAGSEPLDVLLGEAERVTAALSASDLYGAIQMPPSAGAEDLLARIERLSARFLNPPAEASPPKVERLRRVAGQLGRTALLFRSPRRRLQYDLRRGFVRAAERRAAGEDFALLRTVWCELFPEQPSAARDHHREACRLEGAGRRAEALDALTSALELDPFNLDYWERRALFERRLLETPAEPAFACADLPQVADEREIRSGVRAADRVPTDLMKLAVQVESRLGSTPHGRAERTSTGDLLELGHNCPPAEAARIRHEVGLAHLRRSDYQNARVLLASAIELDPQPDYLMSSAWAMIVDASFDRARAETEARPLVLAAIAGSRKDTPDGRRRIARGHYFLGRLLRDLGSHAKAETELARAVAYDPRLVEACTELRLIRMRTQRKRGLRDLFKR